MQVDYLVVGSGLTGATIARLLHDAGREVLVVERRAHLGSNVHDHVHPSGIRVHTYGPHYFRTSSARIWAFVKRFATFYEYVACLKSYVDHEYENWPVNSSYMAKAIGKAWQPAFQGQPTNFEEASLQMMPALVYHKFVKHYTEKQWGVPAHLLSPELATRFDVRADDDPRLKCHPYQGIPSEGYTSFMNKLLAGIPTWLNYDYLQQRSALKARKQIIFTGPIDEFFGFDLGKLKYRAQQRTEEYLANTDFFQPCGQVNNPGALNGSHIRTLEWKHMMPPTQTTGIKGTVITRETPFTPVDPNHYEYPFPDTVSQSLYRAYRRRAEAIPNLCICGRLGEYRYYDMDQAIARAMVLAQRLLAHRQPLSQL
jgi:UDP-galactopyranose mutase